MDNNAKFCVILTTMVLIDRTSCQFLPMVNMPGMPTLNFMDGKPQKQGQNMQYQSQKNAEWGLQQQYQEMKLDKYGLPVELSTQYQMGVNKDGELHQDQRQIGFDGRSYQEQHQDNMMAMQNQFRLKVADREIDYQKQHGVKDIKDMEEMNKFMKAYMENPLGGFKVNYKGNKEVKKGNKEEKKGNNEDYNYKGNNEVQKGNKEEKKVVA